MCSSNSNTAEVFWRPPSSSPQMASSCQHKPSSPQAFCAWYPAAAAPVVLESLNFYQELVVLTQDLVTDLFTDAHFISFWKPTFSAPCNSKPDWDPQQVAQIGLVYQCLGSVPGSALNTGIFQLWKQASVQKAPISYLLMPHRTHFNVTPDKLSAPFISSNNSRKVLPSAGIGQS